MHQLLQPLVSNTLQAAGLQAATGTEGPHRQDGFVGGGGELQAVPDEQLMANQMLFDMAGSSSDLRDVAAEDPDCLEASVLRQMDTKRRECLHSFLQSPMMIDRCFVVMKAITPEVQLMESILASCSTRWEASEMAKLQAGIPRQYRLGLLYGESKVFKTFMTQCASLLRNDDPWQHLIPSQDLASDIVVAVLRSAAVVFELLVADLGRYPAKLFRHLEEGNSDVAAALAAHLLQTPKCCLDPFTKAFVEHYGEELQGPEARCVLLTLMRMLDANNFSCERLHSKNLRLSKMRVNTVPLDVAFLGAHHQAFAGPKWVGCLHSRLADRQHPSQHGPCHKSTASASSTPRPGQLQGSAEDVSERKDSSAPSQKKRKRGGGGAFRAFLHEAKVQFKGQNLAEAYRNLSEEDLAHYRLLARRPQQRTEQVPAPSHLRPRGKVFLVMVWQMASASSCPRSLKRWVWCSMQMPSMRTC